MRPDELRALGKGNWQTSIMLALVYPSLLFIAVLLSRSGMLWVRGVTALTLLLGAGVLFLYTTSNFLIFVTFECLLLISLYLLRLTSKSERILEATLEMFAWTLAGSFCLFFAFVGLAVKGC